MIIGRRNASLNVQPVLELRDKIGFAMSMVLVFELLQDDYTLIFGQRIHIYANPLLFYDYLHFKNTENECD